ncbi:hypothetical protein ACFL6Y_00810 [Elusimicrobiota bacterium]
MAGELIQRNQAEDREVYAYVYSDLGDILEFLDNENGRYGASALRRLLK